MARLCLAGAGSLISYAKNGYGYKNSTDKDMLALNQPYDFNPAYDPDEGGGLDKLTDVKGLRERSLKSTRNSESPKSLRYNAETRESQFVPPGIDGLTKAMDDMGTPSMKKRIGGGLNRCRSEADVQEFNLYERKEMIPPKTDSGNKTTGQDLVRMNENSVWWQPREIHKKIRDRKDLQKNKHQQIEFHKEFKSNTDIYQFGCTLWEMFSYGKTPFRSNFMDINFSTDAEEILRTRVRNDRNAFEAVNYDLERSSVTQPEIFKIIKKCTAGHPDNRPDAKLLVNYHMINVLSFNGLTPADVECRCARGQDSKSSDKAPFSKS